MDERPLANAPFAYDDRFLEAVAGRVVKEIVLHQWDAMRRVFLCGAASSNRNSLRSRVSDALRKREGDAVSIYYPENLFEELLTGVGHHDLLSLENLLAEGVTAIVIILESAGALTELGAFANHAELRKKLVVVQGREHARDRSFIQLGPVRLLERLDKGRVINADFQDPDGMAKQISRAIWSLHNAGTPFKIGNLFHAQEFLLPALYALHVLSRQDLVKIVAAGGSLPRMTADAIVAASLSMLLSEGLIASTPRGFTLSAEGLTRVRSPAMPYSTRRWRAQVISGRARVLDSLRIEVLNRVCRWSQDSFPRS